MSFKGFFFSSGDHFVQQSKILAILVKGDKRNISVKSFSIRQLAKEEMFKVFFFFYF